jgi:Raf kinase inhibitor-like YbhB/YbcL family protein
MHERPSAHPWTLAAGLAAGALAACPAPIRDFGDDDDSAPSDDDDDTPLEFRVWSPDFVSDEEAGIEHDYDCHDALPPEFSCFNANPEIRWEGVPAGAAALALIFDDPTAGDFPHWAIYNIPADLFGLDAGISGGNADGDEVPEGATELENGFGTMGYLGSCPAASSINEYRWRLWALGEEVPPPSGGSAPAEFDELAESAEKVAIEQVETCHVFDGANADI